MCSPVYAAAANRGIAAPLVDCCELWVVGAMLRPPESEQDRMRREDAEVFAERLAAAERGEEYEPEPEPFAATDIRGPFAPPPRMVPPPPGVN